MNIDIAVWSLDQCNFVNFLIILLLTYFTLFRILTFLYIFRTSDVIIFTKNSSCLSAVSLCVPGNWNILIASYLGTLKTELRYRPFFQPLLFTIVANLEIIGAGNKSGIIRSIIVQAVKFRFDLFEHFFLSFYICLYKMLYQENTQLFSCSKYMLGSQSTNSLINAINLTTLPQVQQCRMQLYLIKSYHSASTGY